MKDKSNNALARDIKEIVPQDIVKIESATPVTITMEDGSTFVAHRFDFISEYEAEMIKQGRIKMTFPGFLEAEEGV